MTSYRLSLRATIALSIALALCTATGTTSAQAPAAAPNPVALPKPVCGTNPEFPGRLASDRQELQWRRDATPYTECYKKFAVERRELAQQYQEAANAAIAEYNAVVK